MMNNNYKMDEMVRRKLLSQMQNERPENDPYDEYSKASIDSAALGGFAGGMAQLGTVHGKTPDASPYIEASQRMLQPLKESAMQIEKQRQVDPRILAYLTKSQPKVAAMPQTKLLPQRNQEGFYLEQDPTGQVKPSAIKGYDPPRATAKTGGGAPPEGKPMNEGEMQRFDNVRMGLTALDDAEAALKGGDWTFSLAGDNKYTEATRRFSEALGRMQSGGAIQKEEEEKFKAMLPTWKDRGEIAKIKIQKARDEFKARMETLKASGKKMPSIGADSDLSPEELKEYNARKSKGAKPK